MRTLITGADGFIGRALCAALAERGLAWSGATRNSVGDIARGGDWNGALRGCERLVHLANLAHARNVTEAELTSVNVEGTRRLAEQAAAVGVRRFVYLSSVKAAQPDDVYGCTKLAAERTLAGIKGLEVVVLRPPLVYGPGVKGNFLALMRAVDRRWPLPFSSVRSRRSLVYLGNLVDAIICSLDAPQSPGKTYSVSDGEAVSTPDLVRAIARALGRDARLMPFPPIVLDWIPPLRRLTRSLVVDDDPIRSELGWRPVYSLDEGLRVTANWYKGRCR